MLRCSICEGTFRKFNQNETGEVQPDVPDSSHKSVDFGEHVAVMANPPAVSKNPFAMLDDDDDAPVTAAPAKEVTKRAPNPAPKKDAPPAAAGAAKASEKTDKRPPSAGGPRDGAPRDGQGKRPPKREFDRHSGTGRGARSDGHEEKKGGHGKGNWGGKGQSGEGAEDGEDAEPKELTEEEKAAQEAAAEERRKEAAQLTLEEYMKKKAKEDAEKEKEKLKMREPEKIDMKGLKILDAPEDEVEFRVGESKTKKEANKEKKAKEMVTDLNFTTPPIETASPSSRGSHLFSFLHLHTSNPA
jgi:hypothetical protein